MDVTSQREIRECEVAWHVFIQWLATNDMLDWWLDWLVETNMVDNMLPYHSLVSKQKDRFKFMQYTYVCPGWHTNPLMNEDDLRSLSNEWNDVADKIDEIFKTGEMI